MKKIFLFAILLISVKITIAQVKFDALQFTPQMPKAGQRVSFKFNKKLSPLIDEKKVDILIYLFGPNGHKVLEPSITQTGTVYSGNFKLDSNTACLAFSFVNKDKKVQDNNTGNGYIVPVYAKNNQPVTEYYVWAARLYGNYGEELFGIKASPQKILASLEEGLKINPDVINDKDYLTSYLQAISTVNKISGDSIILARLKKVESKKEIKESDYSILIQWYKNLKMKSTSDSFTRILKEQYPAGVWKKMEMINAINKAKTADEKRTAFEVFIQSYPPDENEKKSTINFFKGAIASAYYKEKNYDAFNIWIKDLPIVEKAGFYNDLTWNMALAKENLKQAKAMSFQAITWAKKEMDNPSEKKPDYETKKAWDKERRYTYGMFADTYSLILYELGDYKKGYQYAKESAIINEFKNAEYNERYAQLLVKVMPAPIAKKEIEKLVKDAAASSKTKALLKELYVAEAKSDKGFNAYLLKLEMAAIEKKREELAKTMINEEAPKFSLKDLDGNDVNLLSLKGKIVIVDFWATWCGPCIASMPAMKTVLEQLKSRSDVAFIFVDTWDSGENMKKNAADFMTKNNYPFHVLLDEENIVVGNYKVNGIPTKFVIDKTGNIRFKSIGFDGNDDALVEEIKMMIEMASADMPVKKYVK